METGPLTYSLVTSIVDAGLSCFDHWSLLQVAGILLNQYQHYHPCLWPLAMSTSLLWFGQSPGFWPGFGSQSPELTICLSFPLGSTPFLTHSHSPLPMGLLPVLALMFMQCQESDSPSRPCLVSQTTLQNLSIRYHSEQTIADFIIIIFWNVGMKCRHKLSSRSCDCLLRTSFMNEGRTPLAESCSLRREWTCPWSQPLLGAAHTLWLFDVVIAIRGERV